MVSNLKKLLKQVNTCPIYCVFSFHDVKALCSLFDSMSQLGFPDQKVRYSWLYPIKIVCITVV